MSDLQSLKEELSTDAVEPLLPIEKRLIGWSLGIGISLLIGLFVLNKLLPIF